MKVRGDGVEVGRRKLNICASLSMTMINENELVIRWLKEPLEATCAICKRKRPMKFKKGPVVSLISGELVCAHCADAHDSNLWDVCSNYDKILIDQNIKISNDRFLEENGNMGSDYEKYDMCSPKKYDAYELRDEEPYQIYEDKCAKCANKFQPRKEEKAQNEMTNPS